MDIRAILFVDGENLVFRFQEGIKAGRVPADGIVHEQDCFVWHPDITKVSVFGLFRVCYYTSVVGDDKRIEEVKQKLSRITFRAEVSLEQVITGQVIPLVFKKLQQSNKTRIVDIHLVIDVLKYAHLNAVDLIYLISGDGDYLPLIQEVMRQGKQVYVGALSSGLAKPLVYSCDEFFDLDKYLFKPTAPAQPPPG